MRALKVLMVLCIAVSLSGVALAADDEESSSSGSGSGLLTGALMGGLLGGGVGAAIGSASGKAGTGALIGAGVGAVGGSVLGASKDSKERAASQAEPAYDSGTSKAKKRIIREYDESGNVISEKEVRE